MFLMKRLSLLLVLALASTAHAAETYPGLEVGRYKVKPGSEEFCVSFKLGAKAAAGGKIEMGPQITMLNKNSKTVIKSDIDENCEFRQVTARETRGGETRLMRVNGEFCDNKRKTEQKYVVTFRGPEIHLEFTDVGPEGTATFLCNFAR